MNIPIPTKMKSKMGGEFTYPKMGSPYRWRTYPKMGSQNGLDNRSHIGGAPTPKWDPKTVLTTTAISVAHLPQNRIQKRFGQPQPYRWRTYPKMGSQNGFNNHSHIGGAPTPKWDSKTVLTTTAISVGHLPQNGIPKRFGKPQPYRWRTYPKMGSQNGFDNHSHISGAPTPKWDPKTVLTTTAMSVAHLPQNAISKRC